MKKIITVLSLIFLLRSFTFPQVTGGSTIVPGELAFKVGISAGPSFGFFLNNYKCNCDYLFTNGNGAGFFINLFGTYPIDYYSDILFSLGFQYNKLSASQQQLRLKEIKWMPDPQNILMQSDADLNLSYLDLNVFYKRKFYNNLFFVAGIGAFINLKSKITQNETIIDSRFVFDNSGTNSSLIYDGDLQNSNSLLLSGRLGLGYDFYYKSKYVISPIIILVYPFTNLTSTDTWKVFNVNVGVQFMYVF